MTEDTKDPCVNFYAIPALDEIIAQQGKGPVTDIQTLHGDFWPEDEPIEDFLTALRDWRGHGKTSKSDATQTSFPSPLHSTAMRR